MGTAKHSTNKKRNANLGCYIGTEQETGTKPKPKSNNQGVKFCPQCGSTDIFFASGLPQLRSLWDCRRCGYRGGAILEDSRLSAKLEEEYFKRTSNVET